MLKIKIILVILLVHQGIMAQRNKQLSFALTNSNSAMPFSKLASLVTGVYHPGFEIGYGYNFKTKSKYDFFQEFKIGYTYHRFVQHSIPLYTNVGYRYKFNHHFSTETALGAGYMQSIAATGLYKLDGDGNYKNKKGVGRAQFIAGFGISVGYIYNPSSKSPVKTFLTYQQRLQFPFVKSYVPLLPYNILMLGVSVSLKHKTQSHAD